MTLHTVLFPVAIIATLLLALFGTRAITGAISKAPRKVMFKRAMAVILAVALTGSSWAGWFGTAGPKAEPAALPDGEPLVATAAATEPKDEPIPPVNLTELQVEQFLKDYSTLADWEEMVASGNDVRKAAIRAFGVDFTDPLYMPLADWLDKVDQILSKDLTNEQKEEQLKQLRHDVYQSIIKNPVLGDAWAQCLSGIPLVAENNPWLAEFAAQNDEYYARPNPTKDSDLPVGLDNWLEWTDVSKTQLKVNQHYATVAVKICTVLEYFEFQGVTTRTSARNWCQSIQGEDSRTRAQEAKYQENRKSLLLVYVGKDGKEIIALGVNLYDQRPMYFDKTTPVTPIPEQPQETPQNPPKQDDPEPELPPEQPKVKDYNLTIKYLETGTEAVLFPQHGPVKVTQGTQYSVKSPQKEGYTCSLPTVAGTMPAQDQTIVVWYTPKPVEVSEHILQIQYYLEDGVTPAPGITWVSTVLKTGASYSYNTPELKGYTPDRKVVSGTMPDRDHIEKVIYRINSYELLIHYKDRETKETLAKDYVHDYKYLQWYDVPSPEIKGYTTDTPRVQGQMPDRDVEITVWYDKIKVAEHTLTIYYEFIGGGRAAPTYRGTYKEGQSYSVRSPEVSGWTPVTSLVEGVMGNRDLEFTVYYTKDGNGVNKDPNADPGPQGNAPEKGGTNDTTQGEGGATGVEQPEKPPVHDYGNGDQSTGQDRNDLDKDGNSTEPNVPGKGDDESSGKGGVDHPQEDGEGGNTENGDIPDKDPIPEHDDNTPATGGDNGWADEEIGEPPV